MSNGKSNYPTDDFKEVAKNAAEEIVIGMIIGYDDNGNLKVYGGGLLDGKQLENKDWLWILETVKSMLIRGKFTRKDGE